MGQETIIVTIECKQTVTLKKKNVKMRQSDFDLISSATELIKQNKDAYQLFRSYLKDAEVLNEEHAYFDINVTEEPMNLRLLLDSPIELQDLPTQVINALKGQNVFTLREVVDRGPEWLLKVPGIKKAGTKSIYDLIAKYEG